MKNKYNLGIIGFGAMALSHYKRLIQGKTKVVVKGVFDINPNQLEEAERLGLKVYDSKEELLNDSDIDIVLVATTNEVHKELVIDSLRAGKHVVCEKPVTIDSAELLEIMAVVEETGKLFTINQNRRVNKDFVLMRRIVEDGMIGKPYVIESRVEGSRGVPAGWRTEKKKGGGMMLDWGVHLIDQILYMYSGKVTEIYCKMFSISCPEVDDNFRLTMTFEDGLVAHIEVGTNNFISHPRWYVLGTDGSLQIDDWDCSGKYVRCIDKQCIWEKEIKEVKMGPSKTMAPRSNDSVETVQLTSPSDVFDYLDVVYMQLTDAIEGKCALKITAEQALRVMRVIETAFKSNKEGIVVKTEI